MAKLKYNLDVGRVEKQIEQMKDLEARGVCAFCPEHIKTETSRAIVLETDDWTVKLNDYPYERTSLHLLIIPKLHAATISELPKTAQSTYLDVISQLERMYKLTSYVVAMRSGDIRYNGSSVDHLHSHLIVGDRNDPNPEPVRFKVSSRPNQTST